MYGLYQCICQKLCLKNRFSELVRLFVVLRQRCLVNWQCKVMVFVGLNILILQCRLSLLVIFLLVIMLVLLLVFLVFSWKFWMLSCLVIFLVSGVLLVRFRVRVVLLSMLLFLLVFIGCFSIRQDSVCFWFIVGLENIVLVGCLVLLVRCRLVIMLLIWWIVLIFRYGWLIGLVKNSCVLWIVRCWLQV